jgi:hypothetical protein
MSPFFSSKCCVFCNANFFGSCVIHILHTGCAKILMSNSGAKRLMCKVWAREGHLMDVSGTAFPIASLQHSVLVFIAAVCCRLSYRCHRCWEML